LFVLGLLPAGVVERSEVHELGSREQEIVDAITIDADLPLTVVAAYRADHPVVAAVEAETLAASTVGNTLALLVNGGRLQDEVVRLCHQAGLPLLGSSANLTGTGTKFRIGTCYELISDIMATQFGIMLPADPGREALPSGHLREQATAT
jgi:hypothetical protein